MTTKERRKRRKENPYFILVNRGHVQRFMCSVNGQDAKCWPVARTHEDAARLVRYFAGKHVDPAAAIRPAIIGSAPGETLTGHIYMALDEGCEYVLCPMAWDDGKPVWGHIPLTQ